MSEELKSHEELEAPEERTGLQKQIDGLRAILQGKSFPRESPHFEHVLAWMRQYPGALAGEDAVELKKLVCACFSMGEVEFLQLLRSTEVKPPEEEDFQQIEKDFDALVPRGGWIRDYVEFTRNLESPFAYHLYCSLIGVGAITNRRVFIDMGQFRIYPALGVILLGPSGVKKTTAGDVVVNLLQESQVVKVYQEKITPEGLVEAMKGDSNAVGLVYAPEMSVFLGKQRYLEGIIPLITRFMDCPSTWSSATIMRGNSILRNIGISCLFCTTPDWFIKNTPPDTFGGGFIARYLLVVQYGTARVFPIPHPVADATRDRLVAELAYLHGLEGRMSFHQRLYYRNGTGAEEGIYVEWYRHFKVAPRSPEHELLSTYLERKPIHVLRLAMVMHLATHQDLELCEACFLRALRLCELSERFLPTLMRQMFKTTSGEEQELVLNTIRKAGGTINHTDLVRRLSYKMKAGQTREVLSSLKEAEMIREVRDNLSRRYILVRVDQGEDPSAKS